jgi:hypothetical protein
MIRRSDTTTTARIVYEPPQPSANSTVRCHPPTRSGTDEVTRVGQLPINNASASISPDACRIKRRRKLI